MNKSVLAPRHRRKGNDKDPSCDDDGTQVERGRTRSTVNAQAKTKRMTAKPDTAKFDKTLRTFVETMIKVGVPGLCGEFSTIKLATMAIGNYGKVAFDAHPEKNRYKDVYCVDESRVVLKWPSGKDDYIHANWVNCPDAKGRFICTQGPTDKTMEEFWRMIFQEKCRSIVMLCNIVEQGKKKCEQYWPTSQGEVMDVGCIKVKNLGAKDVEEVLTQTKIELSAGSETFVVEHFAWNNWPDRGVPSNFLTCFRLINRFKDLTPIVVHCSAGIGRTGTIVGLDILQTRLQRGEMCTVEKLVRELRDSRHGSVQMDIQYVYIARVMIALAENKKLVTKDELSAWMADYDTLCKARGC